MSFAKNPKAMKPRAKSTALLSALFILLPLSNPAHAVDNNLFEHEHSCLAALREYRATLKLATWAQNARCNWHPELGPKGMWYLY